MDAVLSKTWEVQYRRMHRSYARLQRAVDEYIDRDPELHDEDNSLDIIYHFCVDAYHLKDWIKHGRSQAVKDSVERLFDVRNNPPVLAICSDIANGYKHLHLDGPRFHPAADIVSQQPAVTLPFRLGEAQFTYHFTIEADGKTYTERDIANGAIAEWKSWLTGNGFSLPT